MISLVVIGVIAAVSADGGDWKREDYFSDHTRLVAGVDYGYDKKHGGTNSWLEKYTKCADKWQSPIALPHKPHKEKKIKPASVKNFDELRTILATADGQGFQGYFKQDKDCLTHDGLYSVQDIKWNMYKFRWVFGPDCTGGAEHSYQGKEYPSELQFFSYNKKFESPEKAAEHKNGIMVYSYLLQVEEEDNPVFEAIIESAKKLKGVDGYLVHTTLEQLGEDIKSSPYNFYKGSFTNPPCGSRILWAVFAKPVGISKRQLEILRDMTTVNGDKVPDNAQRPIQPLNDRKVYLVEKHDGHDSEGHHSWDGHDSEGHHSWDSHDSEGHHSWEGHDSEGHHSWDGHDREGHHSWDGQDSEDHHSWDVEGFEDEHSEDEHSGSLDEHSWEEEISDEKYKKHAWSAESWDEEHKRVLSLKDFSRHGRHSLHREEKSQKNNKKDAWSAASWDKEHKRVLTKKSKDFSRHGRHSLHHEDDYHLGSHELGHGRVPVHDLGYLGHGSLYSTGRPVVVVPVRDDAYERVNISHDNLYDNSHHYVHSNAFDHHQAY